MSSFDFEDIRPYTDAETVAALRRISQHPMLSSISNYLYPEQPDSALSALLSGMGSVDQFQSEVMIPAIGRVLDKTSAGFTCSGLENIRSMRGRYLAFSNHRDITMDPALVQYAMCKNGLPFTAICVGSNLISNELMVDLLRSNRMIKVIRGIGARELYVCSQRLSEYIRTQITTGEVSVWIAQREGRTKDGRDTTEQGLLKMLEMSGKGTFEDNFRELGIVPTSISYEYESCDALKAREVLLRRQGPYIKKEHEDMNSIVTGIRQQKGHIHLHFGTPLTAEEIAEAARCAKNDRYQALRHTLDQHILEGYRLWKTNYIAHDMLRGETRFADAGLYSAAEFAQFGEYVAQKLGEVGDQLDIQALKEIFLGIYANPVDAKEGR